MPFCFNEAAVNIAVTAIHCRVYETPHRFSAFGDKNKINAFMLRENVTS
jgi:hypothetical protein